MDDCIFCKIVKGEVPSYKVYEDDEFVAFMDIFPRTRGHVQVIPKKHYRWTYDMDEELFGRAWKVAHKITRAIQKSLKPDYVSYLISGKEVPHAHQWIMPRYDLHTSGDESLPPVQKIKKEELERVASLIREGLGK